jgi:hypothetical protein
MEKVEFSAGRYYVGDPCYVCSEEQWDDVLKQTGCFGYESFSSVSENIFYINGSKCWAHGTAFGDGSYTSNYGGEYWVDSGTLGIIPAEAIENDPDFMGGYGFDDFDEDFTVWYDDGKFYFSSDFEIDTN